MHSRIAPMRSRRKANMLAAEKLTRGQITEKDVLEILSLWYFSHNTNRANVFPIGATSVESDTLGLVRSRTGRVTATSLTKRAPAVFEILSRWLKESLPAIFQEPFAFTSISVNHGYAARKHRDCYNVGPSMTKAFGDFEGGRLLYWADDDGTVSCADLPMAQAISFESNREMVLFDGRRCHAVTPFTGGSRYSIVFFTLQGFDKASAASKEALKGAPWPSHASQSYWGSLLSPPKGHGQRGILSSFGFEDKPPAIQFCRKSITKLKSLFRHVLNFVIDPALMSTLTALDRIAQEQCLSPTSWEGSIVDTSRLKPVGSQAHRHWKVWQKVGGTKMGYCEKGVWTSLGNPGGGYGGVCGNALCSAYVHILPYPGLPTLSSPSFAAPHARSSKKARAVVNGLWAGRNVSLMTSRLYVIWRWEVRDGSKWVPTVSGKYVCVSRRRVPADRVTVRARISDSVSSPLSIGIGFIDTKDPQQIVQTVSGTSSTFCFRGGILNTILRYWILTEGAQFQSEPLAAQESTGEFLLEIVDLRAPSVSEGNYLAAVVDTPLDLEPCWTF